MTNSAVSAVPLVTVTVFTVTPVPLTATVVAAATKFVPASVTATVVPLMPLSGVTRVRVGGGGLTVKGDVPLVPAAVVTVTLTAPSRALAAMTQVALSAG